MKTRAIQRISPSHRIAGATFPELLVAAAVSSIILGALMVGSIALQRSFSASDRLARAQADHIRVADYVARDIRNAKSINTTAAAPAFLTVTTGDYYDRRGTPANVADDVPNKPVLGRTGADYGTSPVSIRYLRSGTRIIREVSRVDAGTTSVSTTQIADNLANVAVAMAADGTATITSTSSVRYGWQRPGTQVPTMTFVLAAQPRNPTP